MKWAIHLSMSSGIGSWVALSDYVSDHPRLQIKLIQVRDYLSPRFTQGVKTPTGLGNQADN